MHITNGFTETIVAYCPVDTPEARIKKIQILTAALEQFVSEGYHASTFEKIGQRAGCSKYKVLYYFATKEGLALKLLKFMQLYYQNKIFIFNINEFNPAQSIRQLIELIANEVNNYSDGLSLLEVLYRELPNSRELGEVIMTQWVEFLANRLKPLHGNTSEYVAKIGFIFIMKHVFLNLNLKSNPTKLSSYLKKGLRVIWTGHVYS